MKPSKAETWVFKELIPVVRFSIKNRYIWLVLAYCVVSFIFITFFPFWLFMAGGVEASRSWDMFIVSGYAPLTIGFSIVWITGCLWAAFDRMKTLYWHHQNQVRLVNICDNLKRFSQETDS